jgi:hypothetical protein
MTNWANFLPSHPREARGGEGSGVGVLQRTHSKFDSRRHPHPRPLPATRKSASGEGEESVLFLWMGVQRMGALIREIEPADDLI